MKLLRVIVFFAGLLSLAIVLPSSGRPSSPTATDTIAAVAGSSVNWLAEITPDVPPDYARFIPEQEGLNTPGRYCYGIAGFAASNDRLENSLGLRTEVRRDPSAADTLPLA